MRTRIRDRLGGLSPGAVIGVVVMSFFLGGAAVAAVPNSGGTIDACRNMKTGALRVIDRDAGQTCTSAEVALSWQDGIHGKVADSDNLDGLDSTAFARKIASGSVTLTTQTVDPNGCAGTFASAPGALESDLVVVTVRQEGGRIPFFDVTGAVQLDEVTSQPLIAVFACNDTESSHTLSSTAVRYLVLR